jgi:hypothetical protein
MGYTMKGAPTHYGTSEHKSALKQVSKEEKYAKIIKDHNMTKNETGHWVDKLGRTPNDISHGIKHEQRKHKVKATDSTKTKNKPTYKNK